MENDLKSLRKELAVLENEFKQKVRELERRIEILNTKQIWHKDTESVEQLSDTGKVDAVNKNSSSADNVSFAASSDCNDLPLTLDISDVDGADECEGESYVATKTTTAARIDYHAQTLKKEMGRQSVFALIAPLFGPLAGLFEQGIKTYQHYQKQGKTPVFFMTVTGVIALVVGFGYLLQFSFNEYLGPIGKVFIGFCLALATIVGGIKFTKKYHDMAEYGSSLIALGVVLNYLCAYFAGPYYDLLPEFVGFLLLVALTALAYILALLFETRIVAIITLMGGASMPLVMGHVDHSPQLYLSYLLILSIAMLQLSLRIRWSQLALVSMVLSAGMIEFSIVGTEQILTQSYALIAIVHGFFYAYGHYALRGLSPASTMNKARLMIVISNIMFYLFVSQQLIMHSRLLGIIYLLNIVPWLGLFLGSYKVFHYWPDSDESRTVKSIALLHAGLLAGVGILVLSSTQMMGIIWCLEGLMLIYLGIKFQFISVRVEGYIALLLSLIMMGWQFVLWLFNAIAPAPELLVLTLDIGWGNLIAITLLIYCAVMLLERQKHCLEKRELRLISILDNIFSLFISCSFLLTIAIFWVDGMWLLSIVPMFFLLWRAKKKNIVFCEFLGFGHYLLLIVPILIGATIAGNFHFSEQNIYAQIARIEAFICLWLIAEFYKRFYNKSTHLVFAQNLRKLFYCIIPLFFLPSVLRQYSDYFPLVLWFSSAIALLLYNCLQFSILQLEMRVLVFIASVVTIYSCWLVEFDGWQGHALEALFAGLFFYLFIGWFGKAMQQKPNGSTVQTQRYRVLKPLFSAAIYYFAITLFIVIYSVTANIGLALLVTLIYFSGLFFYRPVLVPVRTNLTPIYTLAFVLFVMLVSLHAFTVLLIPIGVKQELMFGLFNVIAVLCVAVLVYQRSAQGRVVWRRTARQVGFIWIFNLISIAVYVPLLAQFFSTMLGPAVSFSLVVHATIILFQTIKPTMKALISLSVLLYVVAALKVLLWDMQGFSLVQKVVVFILIGLCMLGAAFKFQKMMPHDLEEEPVG